MATILKAGLSPSTSRPAAPAILPPIRYAAAAAAAVAPLTPSSSLSAMTSVPASATASSNLPPPPPTAPSITPPTSMPLAVSQDQQPPALSSPSLTQLSVTSPMLSSAASASQQLDGSFYSGQESPALSEAISVAGKPPLSPQQDNAPQKGLLICLIMNSSPMRKKKKNRFRVVSSDLGSDPQRSCMDYISFFDKFLSFLTRRLIQPILATEAQQLLPQTQPQANGSQSVQSQEQAPPAPGPSPLPQQLQQFTIDAAPRSKSPLPAPQQTQQQPPMFPPGVKVSQAEQQPGAGTSETAQSFAPPQSSSTSQQAPPPRSILPSTFPGSLSDLVVSFESVKQKGMGFSLSLSRAYLT